MLFEVNTSDYYRDDDAAEAINTVIGALAVLEPVHRMSVADWADEHRRLDSQSSAEPGRWITARTEYQREPMNACSDPEVKEVVLMFASQTGKSEIILNTVGYHMQHDPAPVLLMQPTVEMAMAFSKDRISAGLIKPSPALRGLVKDTRLKDANNTTLHKVFPGGALSLVGANSPSALASRPIRIVLCDEVDRYPLSAGEEGDPVSLARRRSATFWNRKIIQVSTPTVKGVSKIEAAYEASDMRQFWVPCHECGEGQVLRWSNVIWDDGDPHSARYVCEHCGCMWTDGDRHKAINAGEWRAQKPFRGIAGFHMNGLYSPWVVLSDAVAEFLASKGDPMKMRAFVNTFFAETWEDEGDGVNDTEISDRVENYQGVPDEVVALTAGVDVQDDRLEIEVVGWGAGEESWQIHYEQLYGDPSAPDVWNRLSALLDMAWPHPGGVDMHILSAAIDSGGHHTRAVYDYAKRRGGNRVFAIKGVGGEGKPIMGRPSKNNIGKIPLYPVGVDTAKEVHFSRLKISEPGPGYCHFPKGRDSEYFRQLTAERRVVKYHRGFAKRTWQKIRTRNEALDLRVYAIAAFTLMNAPIDRLVHRFNAALEKAAKEGQREESVAKRNPLAQPVKPGARGGFANSWR